jgi:hypothetical protein
MNKYFVRLAIAAGLLSVLLSGCVPNSAPPRTDSELPFERGTTWSMRWVPQNSSEKFQLEFTVVQASRKTNSNNYFEIAIKSNRPQYADVASDGAMNYNSAGAGTTYLFFLENKNTTKTINCGFKDIKRDQVSIKGVSYLKEVGIKEDVNPIYYFSLYKGDYSKVGTCTLDRQ